MYKFNTTKENYEDYSSGRVLYGATGSPNFPVRLSSEIFLRAVEFLKAKGNPGPYTVYDPFCGAGYSLTIIGFLHGADIQKIVASDTNSEILEIAQKNISLLQTEGFKKRITELKKMIHEYNKGSHQEALASAVRLMNKIPNCETLLFEHNIASNATLPKEVVDIDLVITDLPYGKLTHWQDNGSVEVFLATIKLRLAEKSIVAISSNKEQKVNHPGFNKLKSFSIGHRRIVILEPTLIEPSS